MSGLPRDDRGEQQQHAAGEPMGELRVGELRLAARRSVAVRTRRRAAVRGERAILFSEHAVRVFVPRPHVSDREGGMPQHERLTALRVPGRAVGSPPRRKLLIVAVVARGFVPVPRGAGQGIRHGRRRQRVLHAHEPPDRVALDVEQHGRSREFQLTGRHARSGQHRRVDVDEVIAVARLHAADLHEAVGAGAGDVTVGLGGAPHFGDDLVDRARGVSERRRGHQRQEEHHRERARTHGC